MQRYDSLVHRSILMFFFFCGGRSLYDRRIYPCEISRKYKKINWNYLKNQGKYFGIRLNRFFFVCVCIY